MDTRKRSMVKSITWRVIGIVLLGVIAYAITGDLTQMTVITILFHGIRLVLYYYHERVWERTSWGKIKHPLADLPVNDELTPEDMQMVRDKLQSLGYID
jgi:uncharacterized membrane protein